MEFTSKLELPVYRGDVRFTSFNIGNYFDVLKYIINNDDIGLSVYFEELLKYSISDLTLYKKLTNVDKFLILLDMRIYALGDFIQLKGNTKESVVKISLTNIKNNIIKKLKNYDLFQFNKFEYNGIVVTLNLPKKLYITDSDELWLDVLDTLEVGGEFMDFNQLSDADKTVIEQNLPANFGSDIVSFVNISQYKTHSIDLIKEMTGAGVKGIPLNLYDNTIFSFLKSIFSDSLAGLYELEYAMTTKLNVEYGRFIKMTPLEARMFINFYNKEQKELEESNNSNKSKVPSIKR